MNSLSSCKNKLSSTGAKKKFSFAPHATDMFCHNTNEQLIEEIFNGEKISFKVPMTRTKKIFISELLDVAEYLVLLTEKMLDQMRYRVDVQLHSNLNR